MIPPEGQAMLKAVAMTIITLILLPFAIVIGLHLP